jgi:hypothetical protein
LVQIRRAIGRYTCADLGGENKSWYTELSYNVYVADCVAVPIELAIRGNSPYVAEVIVFGAGRPQVGCLILPSELGKELAKDREAFLEKIWPVIEDANAQAPTHSRLLPDMVAILE